MTSFDQDWPIGRHAWFEFPPETLEDRRGTHVSNHVPQILNTSRGLSAPHAAAAAQFAFLRSAQLVTLKPSIHVDIHGEIWWGISLISPPM